MSIGSKIKTLRKKRGMTQSELADGIITRGMLSRIEGESAMPSMQSLSAIAKRLEVSPSFLLEDGNDILPAELARIAKALEKEYRLKNYQKCLDIFKMWNLENDTKFSSIFASCAFEVALEDFLSGDYPHCRELLQKVLSLIDSANITFPLVRKERIDFMYSVIEHIGSIDDAIFLAPDMPDFDFSHSLFFSLLKLIKNDNIADCTTLLKFCTIEDSYRTFIDAQINIKEYKFIDAIIKMKSLCSLENSPVFLKLLCLASMENCCKLCEDYKGAYENHLAYQSLLNTIKN